MTVYFVRPPTNLSDCSRKTPTPSARDRLPRLCSRAVLWLVRNGRLGSAAARELFIPVSHSLFTLHREKEVENDVCSSVPFIK